MNTHPGGTEHSRRMLELAALPPCARVLDLGAGGGETVALLRSLGYDAQGIDLAPRSALVQKGDLLRTGLAADSYDALISQCSFFVSGDVPGALRESRRLLRRGGLLLWSDLFFSPPGPLLAAAGFSLLQVEDLTPQWREYYLEALWRGEEPGCEPPRGKCSYLLLVGRKE